MWVINKIDLPSARPEAVIEEVVGMNNIARHVYDAMMLEEEVKLAKTELESNDNDRIVKATEKLSNESQAIFGKIYQQANPNGEDPNAGTAGGEEFHQ